MEILRKESERTEKKSRKLKIEIYFEIEVLESFPFTMVRYRYRHCYSTATGSLKCGGVLEIGFSRWWKMLKESILITFQSKNPAGSGGGGFTPSFKVSKMRTSGAFGWRSSKNNPSGWAMRLLLIAETELWGSRTGRQAKHRMYHLVIPQTYSKVIGRVFTPRSERNATKNYNEYFPWNMTWI